MCGRLFPLVVVCLLVSLSASAQHVVEKESEIVLCDSEILVRLAVDSRSSIDKADLRIEFLDIDGTIRQSVSEKRDIAAGRQILEIAVPAEGLSRKQNEDLAWYRLRYRVADTGGVISVSQITPDLFELRIIAAANIMSGMGYRVRVMAANPFTNVAAEGVELEAVLELNVPGEGSKPVIFNGTATTDSHGFAVMDFVIPPAMVLDDEGEIRVAGRKNGIVREAEKDLRALKEDTQFLMMTDKPIYQPEQTVHIRGVVFKGAEEKTILADAEVEFRIKDEEGTLIFREKARSSDFGIAATAWQIPTNIKLGEYEIRVFSSQRETIGQNTIKISRYDLPNFVVNTKPSKPYYLRKDKTAEIEIRGEYLFGKPITKGKVRVVEETRREWNFKEQKYDINEGEVSEGELDADGRFTARFDLSDAHEELDEDDWERYTDIRFAAYLTDLTTNKTEQRRFDLRVSREPIHVYLMGLRYPLHPDLPFTAYVSTFYADGSPAECQVEIKASEDDEEKYKTVARVRTNSLGAGKVVMMRPKIGDPDDTLDLMVIAKDKSGRQGKYELEDLEFDEDRHSIQISTDRTIYKPGETMKVSLLSTLKSGLVYIDVVNGWTVIDSRFVQITNGRAQLSIPYIDAFKGALTISAFAEDPVKDKEIIRASRGVIFPAMHGISVDARFDKAIYKPNEEATVRFGILDASGDPIESALGIIVRDRAVEERARTDSEFGNVFLGLGGWLGYGSSFGSINVKDLNDLDLTKPIPAEIELVGEVLLLDRNYYPSLFHSSRYYAQARSVFGRVIEKQFEQLGRALDDTYKNQNFRHPTDDDSLTKILGRHNIDLTSFRDPWGVAYRTAYSTNRNLNILKIDSAGPDKTFGTKDDFVAFSAAFDYFTPMGRAIDTAVKNYQERTGEFVRDREKLFEILGIRELNDPFGRPYRFVFEGEGRWLQIRVVSSGNDGRFEKYDNWGDDFRVWVNRQDIFAPVEERIKIAQQNVKKVPMTEAEFLQQLKDAGIRDEMLKDGSGNPLYVTAVQTSRFWDRVTTETVQVYGETTRTEKRVVTPVTQQIMRFTIRGPGKDGKPGTWDDVTFTEVIHVLSEQTKDDAKPVTVTRNISYSHGTGAITGAVRDASGAAIPGAEVTATAAATGIERYSITSSSGEFFIGALPAGKYNVRAEAQGFNRTVMTDIPVNANTTARINITLEVGTVSEVVTVSAEQSAINTVDASVSSTRSSLQVLALPLSVRDPLSLVALQSGTASRTEDARSTPRLREYFPETLFWQPEVVTNADGTAEVRFRMADNITTWKMYTIATTKNGKVGFAEKDVTAFQSFFVDLDPPKFLTEGDEIFLPTQVRNYTEKRQRVDVAMSPADWFRALDGDMKQVNVASGDAENAVFGFKATMPVKEGKQRVTAIAETESDAIEKPVTVRPDGKKMVVTDSRYFNGITSFDLDFPANSLQGTQSAELKIYPNLLAHVAESVEGLLQRPYGCGEQTISSTYPNLLILKFAGGEHRRISAEKEKQARKNLQLGYERLVGYQNVDGGFTYWGGRDESDLALTAYALRFLVDASSLISVDPKMIEKAENYLVLKQRGDGSWNMHYRWETVENPARAKKLTIYITRILAMLRSASVNNDSYAWHHERDAVLVKALSYIRVRNSEIDDPYSLALFGLSLVDAGDAELAGVIADKLITLGRDEAGGTYWNLESNTVFNGWGNAGRIETTALTAQLLMRIGRSDTGSKHEDVIGRAMLFILKNKDRYGVWFSTQTTVNVLDTFFTALSEIESTETQRVDVILNGEKLRSIEIGPDKLDQIVIGLEGNLRSSNNRVELQASQGSPLMAQLVSNYYVGWEDADKSGRNVNQSRAVELKYSCDKTSVAIMQEVVCSVSAERIGFRGYGMLLAEIGIPPGADVSRESLEAALEKDWSMSRYEVLPDRIIVYMWARAGGTQFSFKFRPRYGINAQTPASIVYDYYNPEAQAVNAPLRFVVR